MARDDKKNKLSAGDNSVVIGGNVTGGNIVIGNNNTVTNKTINVSALFDDIYKTLDARKDIPPQEKKDLRGELQDIHLELEKPKPDENFLERRLRNIKRMAPDILDVALETLKNPIGGVAEIMKKVAKKMSEQT